jgi:adenylate cyclase, class 2
MKQLSIGIKARCGDLDKARGVLLAQKAELKLSDHQLDTYFNVRHGRMMLREGDTEHLLVHYDRENVSGPRHIEALLFKYDADTALKEILTNSLGILAVVDKTRESYMIGDTMVRLDIVKDLGTFIEIETRDASGICTEGDLSGTCVDYMKLFYIDEKDLISDSYSDMLLGE